MSQEPGDHGSKPLTEDELDEIGHRAGQALRGALPAYGHERVIRAAKRRQSVRVAGVAGVLTVVVAAAAVAWGARSDGQVAPSDSTTAPTAGPTTLPATTLPTSTAVSTATSSPPAPLTASGTSTAPPITRPPAGIELGARLDLERWSTLGLTGDGTAVPTGCLPDGLRHQCVLQLIDAATLQPTDPVTCPIYWIDAEPAIDDSAVPGFLARYPAGSAGGTSSGAAWCPGVTEQVVLASPRNLELTPATIAFDPASGDELWRREGGFVLSPAGDVAVELGGGDAQAVLDARTGEPIGVLPRSPSGPFVYFDPTGRFAISLNGVDVVDLSTRTIVYEAGAYFGIFDHRGTALVTVSDDEIALIDTATWSVRWSLPTSTFRQHEAQFAGLLGSLSPDDSLLAVGSPAVLIDTGTGQPIGILDDVCGVASGPNQPDPYEWLADSRTLLFQCLTVENSTPAWLQLVTVTSAST